MEAHKVCRAEVADGSLRVVLCENRPVSIRGDLPVELQERLHAASVSVIVDAAPDWADVVILACDVVAAGIETPATLELAGQSLRVERPEAEAMFRAMLLELGLPLVPHDPRVLLHLVREGDFDTLLTVVTVADIAAAWLRYYDDSDRGADGENPDEWAGWVWSSTGWYSDQDRVRLMILELLAQAETDVELGMIAAGPLEDFLRDDESTLRWVEQQAGVSPKLRSALTHAWLWDALSPEAFARVERAAHSPLANPNRPSA